MLKFRVLTALVLLLIIFAMMWLLKSPVFAAVIAIFFVIGAIEWAGLIGFTSIFSRLIYALILVLCLFGAYFLNPLPLLSLAAVFWLWAAVAVGVYQSRSGLSGFQSIWVKAFCGLLLFTACWRAAVSLQAASPWWLVTVFCICWLSDTGAYFIGRKWGKHPLANKVSPKKTWEGFWGGLLLAVAGAFLISFALPLSWHQRGLLLMLIMITALFSVIGDLFVSMLKRQTGLKDTGTLLPGHGGLLDRVDSTLSTVSIFALGFLLFLC
jgi:phosphatidate cytidylyltransferase